MIRFGNQRRILQTKPHPIIPTLIILLFQLNISFKTGRPAVIVTGYAAWLVKEGLTRRPIGEVRSTFGRLPKQEHLFMRDQRETRP